MQVSHFSSIFEIDKLAGIKLVIGNNLAKPSPVLLAGSCQLNIFYFGKLIGFN